MLLRHPRLSTRRRHDPACPALAYEPAERLAILELRTARGWSLAQTADVFQVTTATIASWMNRLDEEGPAPLLRLREPVNKFPDFVRYIVQRLKTLCPRLGKVKIAQILARTGLHLGATTIGRMCNDKPTPAPARPLDTMPSAARRIHVKYPNHLWHVDLTTVRTWSGFWASWWPYALPQCWPFCWWLVVVIDHFSRRALSIGFFRKQPTSEQVRRFLGQVIAGVGSAPKHLITDHGVQFTAAAFKDWCLRHDIQHRLGGLTKPGGIAVIERFMRTLKYECTYRLLIVPLLRNAFRRELDLFIDWYNADRPHMTLHGATPDEVYFGERPACRRPRFEPRPAWPRGSPCARPQTLVKGQPGVQLALSVDFVCHRRHLPRVTLRRAA